MSISYVPTLNKYKLSIKGFNFTPHYATRLDAIAHGLQLIAYYNNLKK